MTCFGAERGNRTLTLLLVRDFKSRASTNSAIPAWNAENFYYKSEIK